MNLPNKLTLARVILIPVFLVFFLVKSIPGNYLWALIVFAVASATDCLDGQIARRCNMVTDFGKFMDPLADKVLVMTAIICFVEAGTVASWVAAIILARELAVTGLRTLAAGKGKVLAADKWGKIKTVSQMVWIILSIIILYLKFNLNITIWNWMNTAALVLQVIVVVATVGSGANYLYKNRELFSDR